MDAGRRRESPGSDTKDFTTHSTGGTCILFEVLLLSTKPHWGDMEQSGCVSHTQWVWVTAAEPAAEGTWISIMDHKPTCTNFALSPSSKAVRFASVLGKMFWNQGHQCLCAQDLWGTGCYVIWRPSQRAQLSLCWKYGFYTPPSSEKMTLKAGVLLSLCFGFLGPPKQRTTN